MGVPNGVENRRSFSTHASPAAFRSACCLSLCERSTFTTGGGTITLRQALLPGLSLSDGVSLGLSHQGLLDGDASVFEVDILPGESESLPGLIPVASMRT
jgi:hypothetical protein